jgi:hypothetical protein
MILGQRAAPQDFITVWLYARQEHPPRVVRDPPGEISVRLGLAHPSPIAKLPD